MAFDDIYPEGHQGGVSLIMHGNRIATNGDLRLEPTPGQWQPVPKQKERNVEGQAIVTRLCYPDSSRHMTGFNQTIYPDLKMNYTVRVEPQGEGILITVDLDKPLPDNVFPSLFPRKDLSEIVLHGSCVECPSFRAGMSSGYEYRLVCLGCGCVIGYCGLWCQPSRLELYSRRCGFGYGSHTS